MAAAALVATDPRTGEELRQVTASSEQDARDALAAAARAVASPALADPVRRAAFLRGAAAGLRAEREALAELFLAESGLPEGRSVGELERTAFQLEAFAQVVERGDHLDVIIDRADPDAPVAPRPDLRRMLLPIGPVVVFGASNFPFAFGVAGGDTASALAAGCPVVVKGHPSQPGLNAAVAEVLLRAVREAGLPEGTFAAVQGAQASLGEALVDAPEAAAVAFTGSLGGGRALFDRAAARPRPIPVYAEMGSINPLVITPGAVAARGAALAELLAGSVAGAAGQLCTKPGVVLVPAGVEGDALVSDLAARLAAVPAPVLLNARLLDGLRAGLEALAARPGVRLLTPEDLADGPGSRHVAAAYAVDATAFVADPELREERFGPAVVLVRYEGQGELLGAVDVLEGQLTATVHAEADAEAALLAELVPRLAARAGRVLFGGVPTGVAVSWAMQHGGPYPATTAPGTTSVGMTASARFLRPVCFQDAPAAVLPAALRDENPLGLWRRVDGELTQAAL